MPGKKGKKESKEKEKYSILLNVGVLTKAMVFLGGIFIIVSNISWGSLDGFNAVPIIKKILEIISTTVFSAGLVSVIVEISTISGIVDKAFKELLNVEFPLDSLSEANMEKLYQNIVEKKYNVPYEMLSKGLYRYEKNLIELQKSVYYEYHNITYYITPDSGNDCFHINAQIAFRVRNKYEDNENNVLRLRMKLFKSSGTMTNEECVGNWKFKTLKINNNDEDAKQYIRLEGVEHKPKSNYYDYKLLLERPFGSTKKNDIVAEYSFDVPMFDTTQAFKIARPCKNITHKFYINDDCSNGDKWAIKASAFSSFYHKQSQEDSNYFVDQGTDQHLVITYENWAIVGCGYVVSYQKVGENN